MEVKITGTDIHGNKNYIGIVGSRSGRPVLRDGLVCYYVTPINKNLPESLFLCSNIEPII